MPDFDIRAAEISADELRAKLAEVADFDLIDVREIEEWDEVRIEKAKLIPLGELMLRANRELDPNREIVLYCAHGVRSIHALLMLRSLGFEKLRSLSGGMAAWLNDPNF